MTEDSSFPERIHGGPDQQGTPLHDFSTNSNGCGPCPDVLAAVTQADATQYPDASYTALRQQLATFHGVAVQRIVLAASASEFIFRITAWVARQGGKTVNVPPHSYGDYAQAANAHRLTLTNRPERAALRWACDPSSPLGSAHEGLQALTDSPAAITVLDRAYEPLRLSGALALDTAQLQTVWQLYTPNKALGLTGVRAAYAIAPIGSELHVAALEQLCASWPVGAHGVAMLHAWTRPGVQTWLAGSLATLREWKAQQIAVCESMGWRCLPSHANFLCALPALPTTMTLQQALGALRAQGVKLRDTASFGLPGHVRISVQPPAAQADLRQAWIKFSRKTA